MAKGQIYIRKFPDKNFYIGQTNTADAENQYNRTAAHTAAACRVNIYGGHSESGGTRWKKAEIIKDVDSLYPEDKEIRKVGLKNTTYYTYDINNFQSVVDEFTKAGFYSTRENQRKITLNDKLDIAEISVIYWYLATGHVLLNKDPGGKYGLKFSPEKSNWGKNLQLKFKTTGIKSPVLPDDINLGKNGKNVTVSLKDNSLNQLLSNNSNVRPNQMQDKIKAYIKAVAEQYIYPYIQTEVATAIKMAYGRSNGTAITIDKATISKIITKLDGRLGRFNIKEIINKSGDNLNFNKDISRKITELTPETDDLITEIQNHYKNKSKWPSVSAIKKDLIRFLRQKKKIVFSYQLTIDYGGGDFTWDLNRIKNAIVQAVNGKIEENSNDRKRRMVYGVCFAICHYIYNNQIDVKGPVLTVDNQEVAVRHPRGEWYSTALQAKLKSLGYLPDWLIKNDATWRAYYDAAMALYHAAVHSSQRMLTNRDSEDGDPSKTNRYYFSNLNLNGGLGNAEDFMRLSGFAHKQSNKENLASKLEGQYKGNYYYYVSSGSIFEVIDDKNQKGAEYIRQVYNDLYDKS